MALVSMRQLLDEAARGGYGVGAFNVNNMEQIQGIMEAARETGSPVIVQASAGARNYAGELPAPPDAGRRRDLPRDSRGAASGPRQLARPVSAIDLGFTSVMMDGSLQEDVQDVADYEYNVERHPQVVEYAHRRGVTVEGELGTLETAGIEDGVGARR